MGKSAPNRIDVHARDITKATRIDHEGNRLIQIPELQFVLSLKTSNDGKTRIHLPFGSISDIHLGTRYSQAKKLYCALDALHFDRLSLTGDIFDGVYMMGKKEWNIGPWQRQVVGSFIRMANQDTYVELIPGNHDFTLRPPNPVYPSLARHYNMCGKPPLAGIKVVEESSYVDRKGRNVWILHGDVFDYALFGKNRDLAYEIGNTALEVLYRVDQFARRIPGCEHQSVAKYAKEVTKDTIMNRLKVRKVIMEAAEKTMVNGRPIDIIYFGHTHMPEMTRFTARDGSTRLLVNDGSCVDNAQLAGADYRGNHALFDFHKKHLVLTDENNTQASINYSALGLDNLMHDPVPANDQYMETADKILRLAYHVWPPRNAVNARRPHHSPAHSTKKATAHTRA